MIKKTFFLILAILIIAAGGWYFYTRNNEQSNLEKLKQQYPELVVYVDEVTKAQESLNQNKEEIENYTTLGLDWKTLADWSMKAGAENYKDYYREALKTYQAGIEKSLRRNTLLMANAASMAKYLEDYKLAEDYYKEAISVSPGDESYYIYLAELYEYQMAKPKEEILAIYDEGLKRVLNTGWLTKRKEAYLQRVKAAD